MGRDRKFVDADAVVDAALELVEKEGIEAFSTRRLASRLAISAMTLYNYFESREAILDKVLFRGLSAFWEGFPESVDAALRDGSDPVIAYRLFAKRLIDFAIARPRLYLFITSRDLSSLMKDERLAGPYLQVFSKVEDGKAPEALARGAYLFELLAGALASRAVAAGMSAELCEDLASEAFARILRPEAATRTRSPRPARLPRRRP
ncbi:MAG: TetR/AcrR family transcriptional regulator [Spirochaetaceae bacterium]|nr:TetR/AcrR family transcriptional regulator [Spirochaetaceae bacterium]